jgi:hypothetical protein
VFEEGRKEAVKVGHGFINIFGGGRAHRGREIDPAAPAAKNSLVSVFIADTVVMAAFFAFKVYHYRFSLFLER